MTDGAQDRQNNQVENNSIAFGDIRLGNIKDVSGEVNIAAGNIYKGYTAEQVSMLVTQISATFQPKPFDGRSPYKGLDYFEEEDAQLFFGREKLVEDLVSRVKDSCTVFITGPSGSGKSSLVRAGLIHALKQGAIPNSDHWLYATMKPGREPIQTLARAVAGLVMSTNAEDEIRAKALTDESIFSRWCEIALKDGREKRVVLFIDQFEEVFTQISREEERIAFLNLLTHAAVVENGRVIILFSMRSDFVPNCATYPKLNALLNQQFVQIGAMQGDELVSAIAQPALRVGLRIDPDLIAQIINDMQGEPGALPLMQFALKDLFDAQQTKGGLIALRLNDYLQRGGIRKALERHADQTFAKLNPEEQELARSIFTGLIEIGRGTQDTRRTAIFDELVPASAQSANVQAIIAKLADARLITTDEVAGKDTVTISHEKLIDAWPWLKKLVNENRDVIALQNEIAEDAKEWEEQKRDPSYLYSGARLVNAIEQLKSNKLILSGTALEYIRAGQARQQRGRLTLIGAISTVIALLILAVIMFSNQSSENKQLAQNNAETAKTAQEQSRIARAGELYALAFSQQDHDFSLTLLFNEEARRIDGKAQTEYTILKLMNMNPQLDSFLFTHDGFVSSIAFTSDNNNPNKNILATGNEDSSIILWDASNPNNPIKLSSLHKDHSPVNSVAFSPNSKLLVASNDDHTTIWNVSNPENPVELNTLSEYSNFLSDVVFSPDGKLLALGSCGKFDAHRKCTQGAVILWDVSYPQKPVKLSTLAGNSSNVSGIAFSRDGEKIASSSTEIILWDISNRAIPTKISILSGHSDYVTSVAFSPNGQMLASGSLDTTTILWDISNPKTPRQYHKFSGHSDYVTSVAFNKDGYLASGSLDGTILLWDSYSNLYQTLSAGNKNYISSIVFSPDGSILASGSGDTSVILWNVKNDETVDAGSFNEERSWIEKSCQRSGRNFTHEEWTKYFPSEEYRKTCEQWPPEP